MRFYSLVSLQKYRKLIEYFSIVVIPLFPYPKGRPYLNHDDRQSQSSCIKCKKDRRYPFARPIAKPAATPPVRGIPKFPAIADTWPVSVKELAMVVTID
jgi:hypothetical protein